MGDQEIQGEIPPKGPARESAQALFSLSKDDLQDLIINVVREARKPTPEEQKKLDEEKALAQKRREEMVELAKAEEEGRRNLQDRCPHKKQNGESRIVGQIHSDGFIHPLCQWCQKEFPPVKPASEMLAQGIM